jgi:cell division protein FtsB
VFGGQYSYFDLRRVRQERDAEHERLEAARVELDRLRTHVDSLERDPGTLEHMAREQLGMVRPGERLYRFAGPDSASRDSAARR